MKIGDIVKSKIKDLRLVGRVMTVDFENSTAGVFWFLKEGGIMCQKDSIKDLILIEDMVKERKVDKYNETSQK